MLQIVLIRPGATDYDAEGRIQGNLNVPLNSQGNTEVEQLIVDLRSMALQAIYTAECEPALQTAEAIGGALGVKIRKLDQLRNVDHGLWQGMLVDDVRQKQPRVYKQWQEQPESVCPPEGEMLLAAQQRLETAIGKLIRKHRGGAIGLVVSEPLATLVRQQLVPCELGNLWKASAGHGRWELIDVGAEKAGAKG